VAAAAESDEHQDRHHITGGGHGHQSSGRRGHGG
jgi:hypothetical protein